MAVLCSYRELKCFRATLMQLGFTFFILYSLSLFKVAYVQFCTPPYHSGHRWTVGGILGSSTDAVHISGVLCGNEVKAICTLHGVSHVLISL